MSLRNEFHSKFLGIKLIVSVGDGYLCFWNFKNFQKREIDNLPT